MIVKLPGFTLTVSLYPRSVGSAGTSGPVAYGPRARATWDAVRAGRAPATYRSTSNGTLPTTWNVNRWTCMGCVSPVRLMKYQSSTVPTRGLSVAGRRRSRPRSGSAPSHRCRPCTSFSVMKRRAWGGAGSLPARPEQLGDGRGVADRRATRICITGASGGAGVETGRWAWLLTTIVSPRQGAEVDEDVGTLGRCQHEPAHAYRSIPQPTLGADLPHPRARQAQRQDARVAAVQEPQPVQPRLHVKCGHTLPLTSMTSPKYSPIQVAPGMSLVG